MVSIWWLPVLFFIGSFIGMLITALMCVSAIPVRAVGANAETRARRIVGRVLTRQDWRADARRPLSASSNTLQRSNAAAVKGIVSALSWRDWAPLGQQESG